MRSIGMVLGLALVSVVPAIGRGEIYKYKKPSGAIVYTDNLAQLPPERREFYNKQREEREEKRREIERAVGKEELARREAEAKKAEIERAKLEEAERQRRLQAIDAQLRSYEQKDKERETLKATWSQRMKQAKNDLEAALTEMKKATEEYESIAIKADFTRLPGEGEKMDAAKKKMEELERKIDALITEVEVTIPNEARKAGIPPGWLR